MFINMKNDTFPLISTIILLQMLILCYPVRLQTSVAINWNLYVALECDRKLSGRISAIQNCMLVQTECKTFIFQSWCVRYDDVIKWKLFPRYWSFVRGIHRSPVNSPYKSRWRWALMFFFFIYPWINGRVNNREAGDQRRYPAHYDVIVMINCVVTTIFSALAFRQ